MPEFKYKAIDQNGAYVRSSVTADNPAELISFLRRKSMELVSYREVKNSGFSLFGKGLKDKDLIAIFVHIEQLEQAGVSLIDAIADLENNSKDPKIKNLMHEVYENIKKGNMLSESFGKRPDIFSQTYVGLIAMGEKTGTLSTSLKSIIDDIKWNADIKRKTKKAVAGPTFGLLVMFVVIGIMTTVVVPKVTEFLASTGNKLPVMTTSLMAFSKFMKENIMTMITAPIAIFIAVKILKKIENIAYRIDQIKLLLPMVGSIITKIESAKFCQFFSLTFKSGLGVLECLDASASVISNRPFKKAINEMRKKISEGSSIASAIAESKKFPSLVSMMFKVGEDSGNMENSLNNIKFFYDREINDSIDRMVSMIQPIMLFVMGGLLGWIAVAVFGPIYGSFSSLK